ncbi:MAG: glycosyl hydrolase [Spirochaetales bacterium]|nr:glycosyl hydrolase [Spirochaetales bacterium]
MKSIDDLLVRLNQLPPSVRSAPFWAWNDRLESEELSRQIRDMKEQGMGGFFMHSREGLETEYLSDEWMECIRDSVDEARKTGMEAWIYDEDKWPSGSAGGLVSASNPAEYTAKGLTAEVIDLSETGGSLKLQAAAEDQEVLVTCLLDLSAERRIVSFRSLEVEELGSLVEGLILVCRMETSGSSEWYNNLAPSDNLNPAAIRKFIDLTHEEYRKRFAGDFGGAVKGFFTDEPNYCDFFSVFTEGRPWLPWSTVFESFFEGQRGYSPLEILPLLFFHGPGDEAARYDYWLTLTELFTASYTRQIYEWCEENGLELTGHVLYENDMGYSVRVSGASMPHYRYMHAPGIDILGDQRQEYLTVKQCTSAANQFGRSMVLTETYGCTGWDFSFAGQKRLGDWQFVMGVNKRCQHLSLYSISGCRKRDYPPAFNYQTPWWPYNHVIEDYFARMALCVSKGKIVRDILLIHPIATLWMKSGSAMNEDLGNCQMNMGWMDDHILKLNEEGDRYNRLAESLLDAQFDFDFGDELILKSDGSVNNGALVVGQQAYKTVVVPAVETIMSSTLLLLEEFLDAGGEIIWVEPLPGKIDARNSDALSQLEKKAGFIRVPDYASLLTALDERIKRPVRISDDFGRDQGGFLTMTRDAGDLRIVTAVNTKDADTKGVISFSESGALKSLDLLSGSVRDEKVFPGAGREGICVQASFGPEESRVYLLDRSSEPCFTEFKARYRHPHYVDELVAGLPPVSKAELTMENALTLDSCRLKKDDGDWSREDLVWKVQKTLREELGLRPVYYNGAPQRYSWIEEEVSTCPVTLEFRFHVDQVPEGPVFAVVEKSSDFRLFCNGQLCTLTDEYYLDRSFLKHRIPSLTEGENNLRIEVDYHSAVELEDIYIVGDFAVSPERSIGLWKGALKRGDWTSQGLYHYPGSVRYRYTLPPLDRKWEGRDLELNIGEFAGTLAVVRTVSREPVYLLRGDCSVPVSLSFDRETEVEIEIVGSLRNMLGPFHSSFSTCSRISWADFRTEGAEYTPDYTVVPSGLIGEVGIIAK